MTTNRSAEGTYKAAQLMALEVFTDLFASTSPDQLGRQLTEQLRELTGAGAVLLITHADNSEVHELLHACPPRHAALFSMPTIDLFCPERTSGTLPRRSVDFPADHPLRAPLLDAGVKSLLRFPLRTAQGLGGSLLVLDLPELDRMDEVADTITLLLPAMAVAARNAFVHRQLQKKSGELELLARDLDRRVAERTAELESANGALRESEELFRSFFESPGIMRGIIEVVGDDILHLSDNAASAAFFGRSAESMRNQLASKMGVPREFLRTWIGHYEESKRTGQPVRFEYCHASGNSERWLLATVTFLNTTLEGNSRYVYIVMDITDRKQAEDELKRFFDLVPDLVCIASTDGFFKKVNRAWEDTLAYSQDELLATRFVDLIHPEDRNATLAEVGKQVDGGQTLGFCNRYRCKDGSYRWLEWMSTAAVGKTLLFAAARDVTERKQAEEALRRTAEDLARSNKDLAQFAYVASHDLKEPLRMVTAFTSLLRDHCQGKLDAKSEEYIAFASDAASRMAQLVDDLLAYSRAGRVEMTEHTDVGEIVGGVLRSLSISIAESDAAITHDPLPTIASNAVELTQVFQNLIGNALKFRGERRPEIHIGARRQESGWLLTVRDNGIGIDLQFAERIFMVFQQLHTRDQYPGTGIGLAICKKIVERHGGCIWVESEPGTGSTFYFTIPDRGKEPG